MGVDTKPYNLQSPEAIAKEYSGNKMKIAQAAQLGLVDPTAAVLAGMFIDRMRGAQQQEQAPQRTVAQQVLAPTPQAPAGAGLGATPQAAQLAAAYPEQGAPPPIPGPTMPTQEPVMAADGGLMSLPVDDDMFEPAYKEGGIVAFASGGYSGKFEELPEYQRPPAGSMGEFFSNMVARPGQRIDPVTGEPIYIGEFLRRKEAERTKSAAPLAAQVAAAQPTLPAIAGRPDIRLPASPGERPPIPPLSGLGEIDVKAPSGLGGLAAGMPAAPKVGSTQKALEPVLKDYMGRSEERDKRLMESLGQDRLQGKVFEGYEKQLREQAEAAGTEKEDAKNMALFKAGLAIMSGTSSNAFENIGKGALTGVADYQEAFKNLKKAERERAKEFALIEQARRAEDQDDLKRRDMLLVRASTAAQARDDFGTKAMVDAGAKDIAQAFQIQRDLFAGDITLRAAQMRNEALTSAAGQKMDTAGQAQLTKLYQEARQQITEPQIRALVAKRDKLDLNKIPPDDPEFNARVDAAYRAAIERYVRLNTPEEPDANPYPQFTRLPASK
jgi:hypothetical protein